MNASILFSWDARGRLHAITERDASNSGYNWTATYDALNRRLSTTSILVANGVAFTSQPTTINSYFDPQKEFLELGVNYGGTTEFKLYGPDLNGVYGGLNGIGGLDAVSPGLNLFEPTISDFRGNILGVVTNSAVVWNPSRPTGFGAVPGYQPVALGNGADIVVSSAWRGRWADISGYYNIGLRPYDPISGRWLTYDSVWNEIDPSGMTFCGGDPINGFDPDGRCLEGFWAAKYQEGYMPAEASSAWVEGNLFGSWLRGLSQGASQDFDNVWNFALLTGSRPSEGATPAMDQYFMNTSPLASPMQNWINVDYGDNSSGNDFVTTFAPLTQNAINSFGVGQTTAEVPNVEVPEPNYNGPQTTYYVTPDGTAVPATGYRAIGGPNVAEAQNGIIEPRDYPGTYMTFNNLLPLTQNQIMSANQSPPEFPPTHVAGFDTLQTIPSIQIPLGLHGEGLFPEPVTSWYPQWGPGGNTQATTSEPIQGAAVVPIMSGSVVNRPPMSVTSSGQHAP